MSTIFQVNINFGKGATKVSAIAIKGIQILTIFAPSLDSLVKEIQKKYSIKIEDIILTFQPEYK